MPAETPWDTEPEDGIIHDGVYSGEDPDAPPEEPAPPDLDAPQCEPEFATYTVGRAALRGGEIELSATDSGIPLALRVNAAQLRRDPQDLGDDLLRLCRLAAARAGLARRGYLADQGIPPEALELLGLPTQAEVERWELADEAGHDYEPRSLLEPDGSIW